MLSVTPDWEHQLEQLWGKGSVRVFISHIAKYKTEAASLKSVLADLGIASFVAHEDIEPTAEWQVEIERALFSMDMLIALLTEGFNESKWTDQEVGIAIGRQVPILTVDRGMIPYGFIGKYQAMKWNGWHCYHIGDKIIEMSLKTEYLNSFAKDAFIMGVLNAGSFDRANMLALLLPKIDHLSPEQEEKLVSAFNSNRQVYQARSFYPRISDELYRMTGNFYELGEDDRLYPQLEKNDIPFWSNPVTPDDLGIGNLGLILFSQSFSSSA